MTERTLTPRITALVTDARLMLEITGEPPRSVARTVLEKAWDALKDSDRYDLAVVGFASMIADALHLQRSTPVDEVPEPTYRPAARPVDQATVEQIHAQIECNWPHHQPSAPHDETFGRRLRRCVRAIIHLPSVEQRRAIRERRDFNREHKAAWDARHAAEAHHWQTLFDDYAKLVLKSIRLEGADGKERSLLQFTRDDAQKWARLSASRAGAWRERARWFKDVCTALDVHEVAMLGQLPGEIGNALADRAEAIWKKAARRPTEAAHA